MSGAQFGTDGSVRKLLKVEIIVDTIKDTDKAVSESAQKVDKTEQYLRWRLNM